MQEPVVQFVIPMAGAGSRFQKAGYKLPKPLIPVLGKPMIQLVVENLTPKKVSGEIRFSRTAGSYRALSRGPIVAASGTGLRDRARARFNRRGRLHGSPRSRSFGCEPTARDRQLRPVRGLLDGRVL